MEEQPQEEGRSPEFGGVGAYFPQPQKLDGETIRWQLDPTDVLDEIKHYLKQEVKDDDGNWNLVFDKVKPLMTDEGINSLMGILRSYLNKNTVLSNLHEETIKIIMKDVNRTMRFFLVANFKGFKISTSNFTQVYHCVENHVYCFLLRAKDNGERLRFKKYIKLLRKSRRKGSGCFK